GRASGSCGSSCSSPSTRARGSRPTWTSASPGSRGSDHVKAVLIRKHGGPEVLEIAELPEPKAGSSQVVLRVQAAGMNHLDTWVRRGLPGVALPLPMIPGSDAAGLIEEVG